jgi:hypothetical protein
MVKYEHYGEKNQGETVYHIFINNSIIGYCSLMRFTLLYLAYADLMGFVPVVEWGKELLYSEKERFAGTDNSFCYFFEPVSEINLQDVEKSNWLVRSKAKDSQYISKNNSYQIEENEMKILAKMIKKYLRFNEFGIKEIIIPSKKMLCKGKILGVHVRGTDFNMQFSRHPIKVSIEEYISVADKIFKEGMYDYIFLATDEESAISSFKEYFGNNVIYYQDTFRSEDGKPVHYGCKHDREYNNYYLGLEILRDVYTLGNCDGLLAGLSNVSIIARAFKLATGNEYQNQVIIDKGLNYNLKESRFFIRN